VDHINKFTKLSLLSHQGLAQALAQALAHCSHQRIKYRIAIYVIDLKHVLPQGNLPQGKNNILNIRTL
jgi:hypothetical protein